MKRFHVHVNDLAQNIAFYSKMFGTEPTRGKGHTGVNHLGISIKSSCC